MVRPSLMADPNPRRIRVRAMFPPGHVRTPFYLRGKTGYVERALGPFTDAP